MNSFSIFLFFGILTLSFSSFGEIPYGTRMAFKGVDSTGYNSCHLFVLEVKQSYYGIEAVKVATDYEHNNASPETITALPVRGRSDTLSGTGSNGRDQIALFWTKPGDLTTLDSYNFKWWHTNHFHTFKCRDLKPIRL